MSRMESVGRTPMVRTGPPGPGRPGELNFVQTRRVDEGVGGGPWGPPHPNYSFNSAIVAPAPPSFCEAG
jgi:hypothetical protein